MGGTFEPYHDPLCGAIVQPAILARVGLFIAGYFLVPHFVPRQKMAQKKACGFTASH